MNKPKFKYREEIISETSRVCGEVLVAVTKVIFKHPPKPDGSGGLVWSEEATKLLDDTLRDRLIALMAEQAARVEDRDMAVWAIRQMKAAGLSNTEIHTALSLVKARVAFGYTRIVWEESQEPPDPSAN